MTENVNEPRATRRSVLGAVAAASAAAGLSVFYNNRAAAQDATPTMHHMGGRRCDTGSIAGRHPTASAVRRHDGATAR
jgi:hypothetical protein